MIASASSVATAAVAESSEPIKGSEEPGLCLSAVDMTDKQFAEEVSIWGSAYAGRTSFPRRIHRTGSKLFIFDPNRKVSMWMSNTPMTLDMLFIDKNGKIINIAKNTTPYSTKGISSGRSINWVLEINGGLSDELNIKNGDRVRLGSIKAHDEE